MPETVKKDRDENMEMSEKNKIVKNSKGDIDDFIFKNEEVKKCSER